MSLYSHSRATEVHSSDKKWVDIVLTCDLYFMMYFVFPTILFCQPEQYLLIYIGRAGVWCQMDWIPSYLT